MSRRKVSEDTRDAEYREYMRSHCPPLVGGRGSACPERRERSHGLIAPRAFIDEWREMINDRESSNR